MRILSFTLLLTGSVSASMHKGGFGVTHKAEATPTTHHALLSKTIDLRGGDAKEAAMTAFQVFMGIHGVVAERAPTKVPSLLYNGVFDDLKPSTAAEFAMESVGTTLIGMVLMTYLATNTDLSAPQIIVAGSVSCCAVGIKWLLQGKFQPAGFVDGFGLLYLASFLLVYPILTGMGNTDLLCKIFVAFPLLNGVVGSLTGKPLAIKDCSKLDDTDTTVIEWMNSSLIMWGGFCLALLNGMDAYEAMKYVMPIFLIGLIDINFVRKQNKALLGSIQAKGFIVVFSLLTYGFWASSLAGGETAAM